MENDTENLRGLIEQMQQKLSNSEQEDLLPRQGEDSLLQAALGLAENDLLSDKVWPSDDASLVRQDLNAFVAVARTIIAGVAVPKDEMAARAGAATADVEKPTPLDLSFAWTRFQRELGDLRRQQVELQSDLHHAKVQERHLQAEVQQLHSELAVAQVAHVHAVRAETGKEQPNDCSKLSEHVYIERSTTEKLSASDVCREFVTTQPCASEEEALALIREALQQAIHEADELRSERDRLDAFAEEVALKKADVGDCKVLHLLRRPGEVGAAAEVAAVARPLAATLDGDLEKAQALRQLERFKRATKKYIQDFREGICGLLGWKVEMRGDKSNTMRWHLTSRYNDGQELIFQLRPEGTEHGAEYDFLASDWAEQLQEDRDAMACLDVYKSVPGLLAHLTSDLLAQRTLQG
jgi:hypothetical protein